MSGGSDRFGAAGVVALFSVKDAQRSGNCRGFAPPCARPQPAGWRCAWFYRWGVCPRIFCSRGLDLATSKTVWRFANGSCRFRFRWRLSGRYGSGCRQWWSGQPQWTGTVRFWGQSRGAFLGFAGLGGTAFAVYRRSVGSALLGGFRSVGHSRLVVGSIVKVFRYCVAVAQSDVN